MSKIRIYALYPEPKIVFVLFDRIAKNLTKTIALKYVFNSDVTLKELINIIRYISYFEKFLHFCKVGVYCSAYGSKFTKANQAVKPFYTVNSTSNIVLLNKRNSISIRQLLSNHQ